MKPVSLDDALATLRARESRVEARRRHATPKESYDAWSERNRAATERVRAMRVVARSVCPGDQAAALVTPQWVSEVLAPHLAGISPRVGQRFVTRRDVVRLLGLPQERAAFMGDALARALDRTMHELGWLPRKGWAPAESGPRRGQRFRHWGWAYAGR